jgi:hypothetical protein
MWLFAFDDGYCDEADLGRHPGRLATVTASLSCCLDEDWTPAPDLPTEPSAAALRQIRSRLAAISTPSQLVRWENTVRSYLAAQLWEAANRAADTVPSLHEYKAMRRHAGAAYTCLALIDIIGGYEVPAAEADSPSVRHLTDLAADLVSWANDIYSFAKEQTAERARHNLVGVLAHHDRTDLSSARRAAVAMHDATMRAYDELAIRTLSNSTPATRAYIHAIGLWMSGHITWSRASARFSS